jgi:hypothetical protein
MALHADFDMALVNTLLKNSSASGGLRTVLQSHPIGRGIADEH